MQLINAMDEQGNITSFSQDMALVLESIASQAAITIQNVRYIEEMKELFRSFVRVMSSAVDERTPYNGSHTRHMAAYGERFLEYLGKKGMGFSESRKEEFLMSIWLHDIGKLITPLEVMNKTTRLLPEQYSGFCDRMERIRLHGRIRLLEGQLSRDGQQALEEQIKAAEVLVKTVNEGEVLTGGQEEALKRLTKEEWTDSSGRFFPWLTPEEYELLSIPKGNLSKKERQVMEEHVVITDKLLSQMRFSDELSHVRAWAASHHELLDGSGYPGHRKGAEIPQEVRILTILDIFDALVADDRPYKPGMPVEQALQILEKMAEKEGKLDERLTRLFAESRCWEAAEEEA